MTSRTGLALAVLAFFAIPTHSQETPAQVAPVVSFCDVVGNPGLYDGKMISIRAKVSDEFEDFTLFDPNCYAKPDIWIEVGGDSLCKTKWKARSFSCNAGSNLRFRGVEYAMVKRREFIDFPRTAECKTKSRRRMEEKA